MCGIIAIILKNPETQIDKLYHAKQLISNRGPDDSITKVTREYIFSFSRLSIVDLQGGSQPFIHDDTIMMCNGEIYNHRCLEKTYGLECKTKSDCECILHLYKLLGWNKTIEILDGDFAILLYDKGNLYWARDRIGVRPLFKGTTLDGNIAFASYARALIGFCQNVQPVLPGWGSWQVSLDKFYEQQYSFLEPVRYKEANENVIQNMLVESVKKRIMSDRPLGCLLSGGLDSSLVCSLLCRLLGPENVRTYSIGMEGSQDLWHAREVSTWLGTQHTEVKFTPEEGFNAIPHVIRDLESYDITTVRASVGMWLLAKYIKENTQDKVLLSGEGADELFCGYLYFHYAPNAQTLGQESRRLIQQIHHYDVLRADRCISSHGLELRVPFLDRDLVEYCLNVNAEQLAPKNKMEKWILRQSFQDGQYLPKSVLWRRKDGMSDGVSGDGGKKWFEQIQDFVERLVSDREFLQFTKFPSKEAYYYYRIYTSIFGDWDLKTEYWMPKWIETQGDPSGRLLEIYEH